MFFVRSPAHPVYVAGIKYRSLFHADIDSGIRSVSIWKALKKSGGEPVLIRRALVVSEAWVICRVAAIEKEYGA
jgi:hypothetical protein